MHELSVVEKIVETVDTFAMERGIDQIKMVTLNIGVCTGVLPEYVHMYYQDLSDGTTLKGSELIIEETEAEAFCKNCGCIYQPNVNDNDLVMVCPDCGSNAYDLLSGDELTIKEIGFE